MNPRDVPIPALMRDLKLDKRGYPIIPLIMVDDNGPKFAVNNEVKRLQFLQEDRCGICGNKLHRARWLVGGPGSAFLEHGAYIDPPMHGECMHYALKVCPYLAAPNWKGPVGKTQVKQQKFDDPRQVIVNIGTDSDRLFPDRPDLFVAVQYIGRLKLKSNEDGLAVLEPPRPYRQIEYWTEGGRIDDKYGQQIAAEIIEQMTLVLLKEGLAP